MLSLRQHEERMHCVSVRWKQRWWRGWVRGNENQEARCFIYFLSGDISSVSALDSWMCELQFFTFFSSFSSFIICHHFPLFSSSLSLSLFFFFHISFLVTDCVIWLVHRPWAHQHIQHCSLLHEATQILHSNSSCLVQWTDKWVVYQHLYPGEYFVSFSTTFFFPSLGILRSKPGSSLSDNFYSY